MTSSPRTPAAVRRATSSRPKDYVKNRDVLVPAGASVTLDDKR